MARKGSAEYKEARKRARREAFVSRSIYPKLVEANRAHDRLWEARNRGARTTQARKEVRERFADYNEAFDAGIARRMGEDKPKGQGRKRGQTAHVPAGYDNSGQFTGPGGNPPREAKKGAKPARKPKASAPINSSFRQMTPSEAIADAHAQYNQEIAHYGAGLPADAEKRLRALRDKRIREARNRARAKVPSGAADAFRASGMSAQEWNRAQKIARKNPTGRVPTRMNRVASGGYAHQGKRSRRSKAQAEPVYMDARGGHAAYRRRHPR